MADRIYKARLAPVYSEFFPEASEGFTTPHAGGIVPYVAMSTALQDDNMKVETDVDGITIRGGGISIRVERSGFIEIGA